MADRGVTITSLPPVSNATANDLLVIVRNPSSSGNTSKIAFKNVFSSVDSNIIPTVNTSYNLGIATKQWGNVFASAVRSGGNVTITSVGNTWAFGSNGTLTFPDNTVQTTAFSTNTSYIFSNNQTFSGNVTISGDLTVNTVNAAAINLTGNISGNTNGYAIGYRDVPQNFTNTSFTLALTDAGKHILTQNTGSSTQTITIANNTSVAFQTGTAITIVVQSTGTVAVANGADVTMYLAGNSTAKSTVTLNSYSMATLLKIGTNTWMISGTGAT